MKKVLKIFFCLNILYCNIFAQIKESESYWIFLRDKSNQTKFTIDELGITERALKRRAKLIKNNRLMDEYDIPVLKADIDSIKKTGVKIRNISRWLNAVSVEATKEQLLQIQKLKNFLSCNKVQTYNRSKDIYSNKSNQNNNLPKITTQDYLSYGYSREQLASMRAIELHNLGINGSGVLIGMIDDGFNNYRTHSALKNITVLSDSNFIHNIKDVNRQPWESPEQGNHGAGTLSLIGGYDYGRMIGVAYGAEFILAKTEMDSSGNIADFQSEEDTYVAAVEWMERLGADIISSSLGYKDFAPPLYTTLDLDGRTTKVAKAVSIATRKGVLVVTAMGNEGSVINGLHQDTTLLSPADADSILAVGAATYYGNLASFSSCGPSADGRIKPDVVAQGVDVYWANGATLSSYNFVSGTSCSTPLVAGAAALILSVHPNLNNMQIRNAILSTTKRSTYVTMQNSVYPNNYYGYGFIDAYAATMYYGNIAPTQNTISQNYPNPFNAQTYTTISFEVAPPNFVEIYVYNILGQKVKMLYSGWVFSKDKAIWDGTNEFGRVASGIYFAKIKIGSSQMQTIKMIYAK